MTSLRYLAALCSGILFSTPCLAALPKLTVVVSGLEPATGIVEVSLFDSEEDWRKEPFLQKKGPAFGDGTFRVSFAALPEGEYAIIVVHDANSNDKLDRGFLGLFGEQYGFSGDAHRWFFQPSFEEAKFDFSEDQTVKIDLD
jgi:uncharacterized protein (DUF2141 family)